MNSIRFLILLMLTCLICSCSGGDQGDATNLSTSVNPIAAGAVPTSFSINPPSAAVARGLKRQLHAVVSFSDGTQVDVTNLVSWNSSNNAVATVANTSGSNGAVSALTAGTATISASYKEFIANSQVTVTSASLTGLQISPGIPTAAKGLRLQLNAIGMFDDGSNADLTSQVAWNSADPSIASVSASGLVSANLAGETLIAASLNGISSAKVFRVTGATLSSIQVTPAHPSLAKGVQVQLGATGLFSDGSSQDLTSQATWSADSGGKVAVTASGLLKALETGESSVSATVQSVTGQTPVTITAASLSSISLSPTQLQLARGVSGQLTATGLFSDSSSENLSSQVSWSTSDANIAVVSVNGQISALNTGTATITASRGNITVQTTVTVTPAILKSISITPGLPRIVKGLQLQMSAVGILSDFSTVDLSQQVTWSASDSTIISVTSDGLVTGLKVGVTDLSASFQGIASHVAVSITAATLRSLSLEPSNLQMAKGLTQQLRAQGIFSDNQLQDLTNQVAWESTDRGVVDVSSTGLATAVQAGTARIRASLNGISVEAPVTVSAAKLQTLVLAPVSLNLPKGALGQMRATGIFSDHSSQDLTSQVTWLGLDPDVLSVNPRGLIRGIQLGTAEISATLDGVQERISVNVTPAVLQALTLQFSRTEIPKGFSSTFLCLASYSDGTVTNSPIGVQLLSDAPEIASFSSNNQVIGNGVGTTTLRATLGNISTTAQLTVTPAELIGVVVLPQQLGLPAGISQQLNLTGNFSDGSQRLVTAETSWGSSDPETVSVSSSGLLTGVKPGGATVRYQIGVPLKFFFGGSIQVAVNPAELTQLQITPSSTVRPSGLTTQLRAIGTFTDQSTQDLTSQVTWESLNPQVAAVSNLAGTNGAVSHLNVGSTTVKANLGTVSAEATVNTSAAQITDIEISPLDTSLGLNVTQQFQATAVLTDSSRIPVTSQVTWTSSDPLVASISNLPGEQGLARGLKLGTTNIQAQLGTFNSQTGLTVRQPLATGTFISYQAVIDSASGSDLAAGDFNNDGRMDFATVNGAPNAGTTGLMRILLANPQANSYTPYDLDLGNQASNYGYQLSPTRVLTSDLDGDGQLDLLLQLTLPSGTLQSRLLAMRGLGTGNFTQMATIDAPTAAIEEPTLGDYNGDGKTDVAFKLRNDASVSSGGLNLALGDGTGNFGPPAALAAGNVTRIAAGELSGDTKTDLAMLAGTTVNFMVGPSTIELGNLTVAGTWTVLADLNQDGISDLIVADLANTTIYFGAGQRTFGQSLVIPGGGFVRIGDLNGDGWPDLVRLLGDELTVSFNRSGSFPNQIVLQIPASYAFVFLASPGPGGISLSYGESPSFILTDYNADGLTDIVHQNPGLGLVLIPGSRSEKFTAPTRLSNDCRQMTTGDFNGDGVPDVVSTSNRGALDTLISNGPNNYVAGPSQPLSFDPGTVTAADVNEDGKLDLLLDNPFGNFMAVLLGDGHGGFSSPNTFTVAAYSTGGLVTSDFNQDGHLDAAVFRNQSSITVLLGDGHGSFAAQPDITTAGRGPIILGVADADRDGIPDIITDDESNLLLLKGNGNGTFSAAVPAGPTVRAGAYRAEIVVGDLTGDGIDDLIVGGSHNILVGDGNGHYTTGPELPTIGSRPTLSDLNGDGRLDIISGQYPHTYPFVKVLLSQPNGSFSSANYVTLGRDGSQRVRVEDINRDGVPDLVVGDGSVTVLYGIPR